MQLQENTKQNKMEIARLVGLSVRQPMKGSKN